MPDTRVILKDEDRFNPNLYGYEDIIPLRHMAMRVAITEKTIYEYVKKGVIKYHEPKTEGHKKFGGMNWVHYGKTLQQIRAFAQSPYYFSDKGIVDRKLKKKVITQEEANEYLKKRAKMERIREKMTNKALKEANLPNEEKKPIKGTEDGEDTEFFEGMSDKEAKKLKEIYAARRAKLAWTKEIGATVEWKKVADEWILLATALKKSLMSIPPRVNALYASMDNEHEIKEDLEREIEYALRKLKFDITGKEFKPELDNYENKATKKKEKK